MSKDIDRTNPSALHHEIHLDLQWRLRMLFSPQFTQMFTHAVELAAEPMHARMASSAQRNEELLEVHAGPAMMNDNLSIGSATGATAAVTL